MSNEPCWRVEFDERAAKELSKLAPTAKKLILTFFAQRIQTPEDPRRFGKALSANLTGLWRYRVEDYRIICQIQDERLVVLAIRVGHRRNVYR